MVKEDAMTIKQSLYLLMGLLTLGFLGTWAVWLLDISAITFVNGGKHVTFGFFNVSLTHGYHMGLFLSVAVIWIQTGATITLALLLTLNMRSK